MKNNNKEYKALKDTINPEMFVILKDDKIKVLSESPDDVTICVKKEHGYDETDTDYIGVISKNILSENFSAFEEIKEEEEQTSEEEKVVDPDCDPIDAEYIDPELKKKQKKMITQEINKIKTALRKDEEEQKFSTSYSKDIKEKVEQRIQSIESVTEKETTDLKEAINEEIQKIISIVENKTISDPLKARVKNTLQNFLHNQIKVLSESFDDRLKLKIFEIEQSKDKEINDFIKTERKNIDEHIDYVSRELMMEMKDSFINEAIVNESLKYKEDFLKLQEKFKKLNSVVDVLTTDKKMLEQEKQKAIKENSTLKENVKELKSKTFSLIRQGLIRDITEEIKDDKICEKVEQHAKTIKAGNHELFYNELKEYAVQIIKEEKNKKIASKKPLIKEQKERAVHLYTGDVVNEMMNEQQQGIITEETEDDMYAKALDNF